MLIVGHPRICVTTLIQLRDKTACSVHVCIVSCQVGNCPCVLYIYKASYIYISILNIENKYVLCTRSPYQTHHIRHYALVVRLYQL